MRLVVLQILVRLIFGLPLMIAVVGNTAYAAEPAKGKSASSAQIAACQKVRKDVADSQAAQSNTSGSIGAGAAVGGLIGAVVGAAIATGMNEQQAEQAYQDCLAGKAVQKASAGGPPGAASSSGSAGQPNVRPGGKGLGACSNAPASCSEARGMCNRVCAAMNFGGKCSNGCIAKYSSCMDTGVWTAQNCRLSGLNQR